MKSYASLQRIFTISGADMCVKQNMGEIANHFLRQKYHFEVPCGWCNDPNGFIYWNGSYHLFYQHNPFAADPEDFKMFWGHAVSNDLVHWEYVKPALAPGLTYDNAGCWSGNAIDLGDRLGVFYTGINSKNKNQVQCYAESSDGINFTKDFENPLLKETLCSASNEDFRDPQVWRHGDYWYLIAGSAENDYGCVLLYRSTDCRHWSFMNKLVESFGELGSVCECPNFFELDGRYVLLFSPHGLKQRKSVYLIGDFNYDSGKFFWDTYGEIDWGTDFYAPQTLVDAHGRRIMIAWANSWDWMPWFEKYDTSCFGYSGAMSLPRELSLYRNQLQSRPIRELERYRVDPKYWENITVNSNEPFYYQAGDGICAEIKVAINLTSTTADEIEFRLRSNRDKYLSLVCNLKKGELIFDRSRSDSASKIVRCCPLRSVMDSILYLHIYLDTSSIEVFTDDYCTNQSNNFIMPTTCRNLSIAVQSGFCQIEKLETWGINI